MKGAPLVSPASPLLVGNLANVNILAFVNSGTIVGVGTFSVSGNYTLPNNGYLRSDNGITTVTVGRDVATAGGANTLISVRNPNAGKIGAMTVGRWFNSAGSVDFVADTIGTFKTTGYTALEVPSRTKGDFLAANFDLLNSTKVDATSITVQFNQNVTNLLAPGGIGTLTAGVTLVGRVDADNSAGTLGNIGTVQAGRLGIFGTSLPTAIPATLRAVTFGTVKTVINVPLSLGLATGAAADGGMSGSTLTATTTTAAAGIGTVAIASFVTNNFAGTNSVFDVPASITTLTVAEDTNANSEIGAGYAPGKSIKTLTAGAISNSVITSNNIGTLKVIGKTPTVSFNYPGDLAGNITNSVITAEGNVSGVGLGTVSVTQKVIGTDVNVAGGNVTSVTVGGMFGSHLTVGSHPAARGAINATATAANWDGPPLPPGVTFNLGSFKTTGIFDKTDVPDSANFRDSFIIAQRLGTVVITGLDQAIPSNSPDLSSSSNFGVAFRGSSPGPSITMSFSDGGVLKTQTIAAPTVLGTANSTTPPSAFEYANLGG
jgi:hypothetical protein